MVARCAMPVGFLLAIAQASLFAGGALTRLIDELATQPNAARLRAVVAEALDDPSLELVFRVDGDRGFVDSRGEPIASAVAADGRATTRVGVAGDEVAAIWHDPALNTDPELIRAASQATLLALENDRLRGELLESHARIVAAGDVARRRIQRDLHDGAQQKLIALQIKLALAQELAADDSEIAARLAEVGYGLVDAVEELRDLAQGVNPPVLRDFGLRAALASATQRATPPATARGRADQPVPARRGDRRLLLLPGVPPERRPPRGRRRARGGARVRVRRRTALRGRRRRRRRRARAARAASARA